MSVDPFASVTITKPGRSRTQMARPRQEEDDPFAAVQVRSSAPSARERQTTPLAPMQVTAEAPRNPLEMALARTQLAQRGQLQGQFVEQKPKPPVRELDKTLAAGRGLAESGYMTAQGVANILDRLPLIEGAGEAVRRSREEMRQFYGEPESDAARAAMLGTQMLGTGAQFFIPGAAAGRAAQTAQAGSRVQRALQLAAAPLGEGGAVRSAASRVLGGTVMASPLNLAVSQSPEDAAAPAIAQATAGAENPVLRAIGKVAERASQSPAGRFAFETILDVSAGGAGETLLAGARGARRLAGTAMPEAPMPAIPSKPTQETIDRAAFTSKLNRALEAGNDAEVTRLLERQQQLRPLDEQLEDALDRQANARGKKAKQRADAEVDRVLTLMDQQALPVQGPQQWRGPQRFAEAAGQPTAGRALPTPGAVPPRVGGPLEVPPAAGIDEVGQRSMMGMGGEAGLALGGGLAGGTQGETEEERMQNALLLGGTLGGARVLRNLRAGKAVQHLVQDAADPMAQEFIALRNKTTRPGYLSPLAPEELVGKQVHLAHNGTVGFVLTRDGDLQNLFNNGGPRGAAREVIFDGIKAGGKTLDAFDGYLPKLYTQYGFVETGRLPFNDEYAPAGWNFERDGRPDVVFMAYRGMDDEAATRTRVNNPDMWVPREQTTRYFDDYDAAAQNNAAVATEFERARAAAAGTGAGRGSAVDAAGASVRAGGSGGVGGAVASVLGALRARPNNPPAVDRLLSLIDDPITYFRELGDDPAQLTRSLAEFRATTPVVRRLAQEAGDAPEQVDDVLTAARNLVEGRIDALARRTGPLAQMMEEIKGVKETTVEDAAKLAEQNTAQRLKEMRKRGPIDLSNATPAQRATRAMQLGMEDMREAIRRFGRDASEWYSKQGRQASAQMQAIIPELRGNPEKRFIADVILAITSSGATVEDNLSRAIPIIRQWLNTGEITQLDAAKGITPASEETLAPTGQLLKSGEPQMARIRSGIFREDLKGSTRAQAIETGLRKLQLFLDANGGDERAVRNFLLSEYKTKGTAARPSRTAPMSAEVMGPKIGRFLLNVQGMGDEVTVDSWATRTWMRWMGYGENARLEFDPEAKGMVLRGGPTPGEQPEIRNAFTKLAQSISKETGQDFTPADVQALLWYLEKFNYGKWGSTSDLVSFADVGDRFLMEGVPQPQQSNVAGTPYQFKFGTGETSGLDNATLRQYLGQFGREGKVYDIGGALGEGVTALARTPEGRRLLGNVALGTTGYALTGDDDELLRNTGKGMMAMALGSAIYPALKVGVRQGAKGLAEQLQQTPRGRYALNLLSRDITTDPAVRKAVEDALAERSQITARFQELSRRARELGPESDRVISDLLEGEAFAAREMAQMSPDDVATATALAQRIASQVRELGARKVEEDLISEQTFLKRAETYLPRLYARYDAEGLVDEVTATHRGKTFRITGEKIRNDALTPEERDALGEIREASYRLAEAGKRGAQDISTARLFRTLADMPGVIHPEFKAAKENELMAQLFAKQALKTGDRSAAREALRAAREARAEAKQLAETFTQPNYATQWLKQAAEGKGYVRLPDTPNMGQLRGAVVRADVADYLHDLPDLASAPGKYRDLLRLWKEIKTVYNVGTQVTNVLSNFAVVHAAGIPWWKQAARFRGAARDLTSYGPATKALTEAGVMGVNMPGFGDVPVKNVAADVSALRQLAETTRPETRQALAQEGITPYGKLAKLGVKGRTKAQQYYAAGDGVFRVMLYQKYVKDGLTSDEAIQEVMRNMPSYDTRSPILGALRMGPAPFIMYPAKYLPTALDNIMMHPYRWATLAGTTWALMDQASRRLYGKIEEEDLPPNRRRSETFGYLLPGVTQIDALMRPALKAMGRTPDEERKYTIDAARFTPLSALTGSPVPGADLSSQLLGDRAPQILQPSGPLMDIAALALGKNAYTGEDFFSPSDEPLDKALKLGGWASRMALPTFLGVHTPRVIGDIRRGDIDAAMTNALGILGMRPTMVTPGMQTQIQQRRFEEQMSDARIKLRQELRKAKTPEEEARIEQKYEAKMMRLAAKYQQRLDEEEE